MSAGENPVVRLSVRAVVETTLHEPDLAPASGAAKRMREGAAAHMARQSGQRERDEAYRAEVALSADYKSETLTLRVTGRADGVTLLEDGTALIEEIKLGASGMPLMPAHMAQAAMYGHMLCRKESLERVMLRVLYVDTQGLQLGVYEQERDAASLEAEFYALCAPAAAWEEKKLARRQRRDDSLAALRFPYDDYRAGQKRFAQNVFVAIRDRKRLFAQAPTGIGKTMAALFPALMAIREGRCARAVFLTARVTGRRSARDAALCLQQTGARVMTAEIAAKDKVCPQPVRDCRPQACPYAEGFYDRLPGALAEALEDGTIFGAAGNGVKNRTADTGLHGTETEFRSGSGHWPQSDAVGDCVKNCTSSTELHRTETKFGSGSGHWPLYDRERIAALAMKHRLCPFELSLELAKLADVVICDYNYIYDPFVTIDALLQTPGGACLLVDEAHQLGGRVRDALSGGVSLDELRAIRRETGREHGRKSALYKALSAAMAALKAASGLAGFVEERLDALPDALCSTMAAVRECAGELLAQGGSAAATEAFRLSTAFCFAAERADERYALLTAGGEKHAQVYVQCLDASPEILAASKRARGTVYFSATVAPFEAARRTLGSEEGDASLMLPSPFDPAQLETQVMPIDIRYASREATAPQVAQAIAAHLRAHAGHTIAFFPSYAYMERIYELVLGEDGLESTSFCREERGMSEEQKNALLSAFDASNPVRTALFAVLGGGFSEGIDLPGERLKNVIIVSTGLPQPDAQVRAMQAYYDARGEDGFLMAMTLPGMIRVIQAAGRLIRTDSDTGSLLLIDSRFAQRRIRSLMAGTLMGEALGIQG